MNSPNVHSMPLTPEVRRHLRWSTEGRVLDANMTDAAARLSKTFSPNIQQNRENRQASLGTTSRELAGISPERPKANFLSSAPLRLSFFTLLQERGLHRCLSTTIARSGRSRVEDAAVGLLARFTEGSGNHPVPRQCKTLCRCSKRRLNSIHLQARSSRVSHLTGTVFMSIWGNEEWEAVEISAKGWHVVRNQPVRFRRSRSMQPLPLPARGGSILTLRALINVGDDKNWILLLCWLVAACRPQGPYPLLVLQGEQGSAKSTTAKLLRRIIDPATAPLRTPPREERDLLIAANNSWVVAYDNLSGIPQWLSDAFCRLSTGGGFSTRELYSDTEEVILDLTRPVILNGIDHLAERPDLADRAIILNLPRIDDTARRDEAELYKTYEQERPQILGALFSGVCAALARLPEVRLLRRPRMADFALWATAAEEALGFQSGAFMSAYSGNRAEAVQETLESDPVSAAIVVLIDSEKSQGQWTGTSGDLLRCLERLVEVGVKRLPAWPRTPRGLSGRLRRLTTFLRESSIEITYHPKGSGGQRLLTIGRTAADLTATTATTASSEPVVSLNRLVRADSASGGWGSGAAVDSDRRDQPPRTLSVDIA